MMEHRRRVFLFYAFESVDLFFFRRPGNKPVLPYTWRDCFVHHLLCDQLRMICGRGTAHGRIKPLNILIMPFLVFSFMRVIARSHSFLPSRPGTMDKTGHARYNVHRSRERLPGNVSNDECLAMA